jgi:tetratricopeptide (TPR) repeat protein/O-antigen ligase
MKTDKAYSNASTVLGWSSLGVANATVILQPWILGGAIPLSRLTLQLGAAAAISLSLLALAVSRRSLPTSIPGVLCPLLGLACLGIVQLLPIYADPLRQMHHAVYAAGSDFATGTDATSTSRTLAPGDTRLVVAQLVALAALLLSVLDQMRSRRRLVVTLAVQASNAALVTVVALLQILDGGRMIIGQNWMRSHGRPFAAFVNPNNAAGWLCAQLAFAIALFLVIRVRRDEYSIRRFRPGGGKGTLRDVWDDIRSQFATLNAASVSVLLCGVLLLTGIAASESRGGIIATGCALMLALAVGPGIRLAARWLVAVPVVAAAIGITIMLQVDQSVISELKSLSNPVNAGAARLQHWNDSLACVLDFPVVGCGLGAYQFATLPYQTTDIRAWYRNADNQFVELFVETGVIGSLLVGLFLLQVVVLLKRMSVSQEGDSSRASNVSRALFIWLFVLASGQVVAACFDFGISLTATSSLIAIGLGGCLAMVDVSRGRRHARSVPGFWQAGKWTAMSIRVGVAAAAIVVIPDLWNSAQIYSAVIEGTHVRSRDSLEQLLQDLPSVQLELHASLARRPDDTEGLMMSARLAETAFRANLLSQLYVVGDVKDEALNEAWRRASLPRLASQLLQLRNSNSDIANRLERITLQELGRSQFPAIQRAVLKRLPLMPSLRAQRAYIVSCLMDKEQYKAAALKSLASAPSSSNSLFYLGHLFRLLGNWDDAVLFWEYSLRAGSSTRIAILVDAAATAGVDTALRLFGPTSYEQAVTCLRTRTEPKLKQELFRLADQLWREEKYTDTGFDLWQQRDWHLQNARRPEDALEWATDNVAFDSQAIAIRQRKAQLLEELGRDRQALREWQLIQSLDPTLEQADFAIQRLTDARLK